MPTYDEEVLADLPLVYPKLEELSGTVMADSSGNGRHGTIFTTPPTPTLGIAGPIETDSPNLGSAGRHGEIAVTSGSALDVRSAFTWEVWGKTDDLVQTYGLLCRNGGISQNGSNFIALHGGTAFARISFATGSANTFDLSAGGIIADDWYHIVVTRNENVMLLYVNGVLRAQRNDLPTGHLVYANYNANAWAIGSLRTALSGGGYAFFSRGTARAAIYNTVLSAPRVLAHYEAALLNPPVTLRADLHFACTLEISDELPPAVFPFRPDWTTPIKETLSFLTDIRTAQKNYEQRAAIRQRPRRDLEFQALVLDDTERRRFRAFMRANQKHTIHLPIWTDETSLTANAPAGSTELEFESEFLDFNDGGLLLLYEDQDNFELVTIDTVGDSSTTIADETTNPWTTLTRAIPVVRALVDTSIQIVRITDAMEEAPLSFRIFAEDVPLAPHRLGSYTPAYTVDGIQVFDPFALGPSAWNEDGKGQITVRAADPESGAGVFSREPQDTVSREITSYSFWLDGREEIARFLAWWYSMKGPLKPIWMPTLQHDFSPISATFGQAVVTGNDYSNFYVDQENRRDVVFVYNDGTMVFRRVDHVVAGVNQETLHFTSGASNTIANLLCLSFLKPSRLHEDAIDLVWTTDQDVDVTVNFVDLLTTP